MQMKRLFRMGRKSSFVFFQKVMIGCMILLYESVCFCFDFGDVRIPSMRMVHRWATRRSPPGNSEIRNSSEVSGCSNKEVSYRRFLAVKCLMSLC